MTKYVTRNLRGAVGCEDYYDPPLLLTHLVVDDAQYTPTGILTADGEMLYRCPPPIGFGRDEEW